MTPPAIHASGVDWNQVDAVIFDVDGTLFDHLAMRPSMAAALLRHVLTERRGWHDLFVILVFRRIRARLAIVEAADIGRQEFEVTSKSTGASVAEVKEIVARWVYQEPLSIIQRHAFSGTREFLAALKQCGIRTGVFSDYPAEDKLRALGLAVDIVRDATAADIGRLKPNPTGFLKVAELLGVSPSRCLIVGDRDDRDGAAARRGGFAFLRRASGRQGPRRYQFHCYHDLASELQQARPAK